MLIVYFSSVTGNTESFISKLGLPSARIPLYRYEDPLVVDEPYILVCPTYGGGASLNHENARPVPKQVIRFLNDEHNRSLIRGVVASGNTNFGPDYTRAGDVISQKCSVPLIYRFELRGNHTDVTEVRERVTHNAERLGLVPLTQEDVDKLEARDEAAREESAQRLAALRERHSNKKTIRSA